MRLGPPGDHLRGPGGDERHHGCRRRRRHTIDVADSTGRGRRRRRAARLSERARRLEGVGGPLRPAGGLPVPRRRDDGRAGRAQPPGHGGLRTPLQRARTRRCRGGPLRSRDRCLQRPIARRDAAPDLHGEDGEPQARDGNQVDHSGRLEPDRGWGERAAHRLGGSRQALWPRAARAHPSSVGVGRRSDRHALGAYSRDRARAEEVADCASATSILPR